jgi:hypothetical protein
MIRPLSPAPGGILSRVARFSRGFLIFVAMSFKPDFHRIFFKPKVLPDFEVRQPVAAAASSALVYPGRRNFEPVG